MGPKAYRAYNNKIINQNILYEIFVKLKNAMKDCEKIENLVKYILIISRKKNFKCPRNIEEKYV